MEEIFPGEIRDNMFVPMLFTSPFQKKNLLKTNSRPSASEEILRVMIDKLRRQLRERH